MIRKVDLPTVDTINNFTLCVENKREPLRQNLLNFTPQILTSSAQYNQLAGQSKFHEFQKIANWPHQGINQDDLTKLYEERMAKLNGPGRAAYDVIRVATNHCPYCVRGIVHELDHYLPKETFAELALTVSNLVPICRDCNKQKGRYSPQTIDRQFIHPYFDNIETIRWLGASISFTDNKPVISFFVRHDIADQTLKDRITFHFNSLSIPRSYSIDAASQISGIRYALVRIHQEGGLDAVRLHLQNEARSYRENNQNSWQTAMYECLALNDTFCNMDWSF